MGMDDLEGLKGKVFETISNGRSTTVEVEPPKNAGARSGQAGQVTAGPEWFIWYGLAVGLTYDQAQDIPFGELLDYMAIYQFKHDGSTLNGG